MAYVKAAMSGAEAEVRRARDATRRANIQARKLAQNRRQLLLKMAAIRRPDRSNIFLGD